MKNTDDFLVVVFYREVDEARFEELIEDERADKLGIAYEDHLRAGKHKVGDDLVVIAHDGGDTGAVGLGENTFGDVANEFNEVGGGGWSFGGGFWLRDWTLDAVFLELGVYKTDEFL